MQRRVDRPVMRLVRARILAVAAVLVVLSVISFLGDRHWTFDLLSHFRVQFAVVAGVLALLTVITRQWRAAVVLGLLAVVQAGPLAVYMLWRPGAQAHAAPSDADALSLTISYHNLRHRTAQHEKLFTHVRRTQPDVLVLTEMDYRRRADLFHGLRARFPYFGATPGPSIFNVAVFSRFPLTEVSRMLNTDNDWPILHVRVCPEADRHCLRIVALHAHPPLGRWAEVRNAALQEAASEAAGGEEPAIVVGDLNCTPWSPYFHRMLTQGRLRDANRAGLAGTWLTRSPLLGLPVDHILIGSGVEEVNRRIGPSFGSDHFMITADLKFAAPRRDASSADR